MSQFGNNFRTAGGVPKLRHVVVVVLENHSYDEIVGSAQMPAYNRFVARGTLLTRYRAVTHPSLPNYIALVSGATQGITDDCTECAVDAPNLADTLEAAGKTWKTYAEGLPQPGYTGGYAGRYAKKHNPFLYFKSIASKPARAARVVGLDVFATDLSKRTLPSFALVVPDLCNDMHDCPRQTGDLWLKSFLTPLLASPALAGGAVFVVFDEDDYAENTGDGGRVAAFAVGPAVKVGAKTSQATGHYGLLRTVEDAFGLPRLRHSAAAKPITGIWRQG